MANRHFQCSLSKQNSCYLPKYAILPVSLVMASPSIFCKGSHRDTTQRTSNHVILLLRISQQLLIITSVKSDPLIWSWLLLWTYLPLLSNSLLSAYTGLLDSPRTYQLTWLASSFLSSLCKDHLITETFPNHATQECHPHFCYTLFFYLFIFRVFTSILHCIIYFYLFVYISYWDLSPELLGICPAPIMLVPGS